MPTNYSAGGEYTNNGYQTALAMINERRQKAGLAAATLDNQTAQWQRGSVINTLRAALEPAIVKYSNTLLNPGGSIEGATAPTFWTKATVLAAIPAGGSSPVNWTNVPPAAVPPAIGGGHPSDNPPQYGDTLGSKVFMYKQWLNEIFDVCRKLTHIPIRVDLLPPHNNRPFLIDAQAKKTAANNTGSYDEAACDLTTPCIAGEHPNTPWGRKHTMVYGAPSCTVENDTPEGTTDIIMSYSAPGVGISEYPVLFNSRGKIRANLSNVSAGTLKVYLKLNTITNPGLGSFETVYDQARPVASAAGTFGEWAGHGMTLGAVSTSNMLGEALAVFLEADQCHPVPLPPGYVLPKIRGWELRDGYAVVAPTFLYT